MKKISLTKIIVALCICNAYIFTCGVMGVVEEQTASAQESVSPSAPEDDGYTGQGTVDFIVPEQTAANTTRIETQQFQQLSMAQRAVQSSYEPDFDELPTAEAYYTEESDEVIMIDSFEAFLPEETDETIRPETTTSTTTAATTTATTTAATTTTTKATTTSAATTTTRGTTTLPTGGGIRVDDDDPRYDDLPDEIDTAETEDAAPTQPDNTPNTDAANETLYVTVNGMTVSGPAIDIISRITQNEVGYTFAPEAIKAQAVAAYTYVKYCNKYGTYPSVLLSSSVNDSVRVLVSSVLGEAVYYNGDYIQAVYSASSAGYTASSLNTWGNEYSYLSSVYCELDKTYDPNYGRTVQFSSNDIKSRVYNATGISLTGDPSGWLSVDSLIDGAYVGQMNVGGYHSYTDSSGSSVKITGRVFRERIMSYDIRSHSFDVSYDSSTDMFTFTTYGYGHGVGMSQNGANNLATYWGYDYKQILKFYYTGCEVH